MKWIVILLFPLTVFAADNTINIDQVGNNNTIIIDQQGIGHSTIVKLGSTVNSSDANYVSVTQQGTGAKSTSVILPLGYNNGFNISQDGAGIHTLSITGTQGTYNSGNNVSSTQTGSGDKSFNLELNGTSGATVNIQQTNATQSNSGSMNITCNTGACGAFSYIRN